MKDKKKSFISLLVVIVLIFCIIAGIYYFNKEKLSSGVDIDALTYTKPDYDYSVEFSEGNVVSYKENINITSSGTYVFEGDYNNTLITIDYDKTIDSEPIYLVLNNANITSDSESVINVVSSADVILTVPDGTNNYITQTYSSAEISGAAVYSKKDLMITGGGTLNVKTNYNDGINCRDDLIIDDVTLVIESVGDAIVGKDSIVISNADINIDSEKEGIKSTNIVDYGKGNILIESGSFIIDTVEDAISASATLQIDSGDFNITTGGGFDGVLKELTVGEGGYAQSTGDVSAKGLKSVDMIINGGTFNISTYEDAVHSDNDLYLTGGVFNIEAGDDGLHANNNLVLDYAEINIIYSYEGIEGSNITINDGIIDVKVYDDAMNASSDTGVLTINGGEIRLYSQGDGIDSNGDLIITDGSIVIENDAIYTMGDYSIDVNGDITVTGGTIVDENGNEIDYSTVMHSNSGNMSVPGRR